MLSSLILLGCALPAQVEEVAVRHANNPRGILIELRGEARDVPIYVSSDLVLAGWARDATSVVRWSARGLGLCVAAWARTLLREASGSPDPAARSLQGLAATMLRLHEGELPRRLDPELAREAEAEAAAVEAYRRDAEPRFVRLPPDGFERARPRGAFEGIRDLERAYRAISYLRCFPPPEPRDAAALLVRLRSACPELAEAHAAIVRRLEADVALFGPAEAPDRDDDAVPAGMLPRRKFPDVHLLQMATPPELSIAMQRDPLEALAAMFGAEAASPTLLPAPARLPALPTPPEGDCMRAHVLFALQRLAAPRPVPPLLANWPARAWAQRRRDVALYGYCALREIDALAVVATAGSNPPVAVPTVFVEPVRDVYVAMRHAYGAMERHVRLKGGGESHARKIAFLDDVLALLDAQAEGHAAPAASERIGAAVFEGWGSGWFEASASVELAGGRLRRAPLRGMRVTLTWQGREVRAVGVLAAPER